MQLPLISPIWLLVLWIANQVLSAVVQSMEAPDANIGKFYKFFYKFMSLIISDFKSFAAPIPPPTFKTIQGSVTETTKVNSTTQSGVL